MLMAISAEAAPSAPQALALLAIAVPVVVQPRRLRGMTTIEALLVAAAFIIVGVIGLMVFQGMGKAMAQALRSNAIVTVDKYGFDVTLEVLNGQANGVLVYYGVNNQPPTTAAQIQYCITKDGTTLSSNTSWNPPVVAGESITCRFNAGPFNPGDSVTYIVYVVDANSGKSVQIAKGTVTVGIS